MRALVDVDYITSSELGNLVRLGFVFYVQFAYDVQSVYHTSKHVQRTLDDVQNSWAMVVCGDGHAHANLSDACH